MLAGKRPGGSPGTVTTSNTPLHTAQRRVLAQPDSHTDESRLLPAWQRYDGYFYRAAGQEVLAELAGSGRLLILSGGYGLLDGRDLIGFYNRRMNPHDWPAGLVEQALTTRAEDSDLDVVAFAAATTPYARLLRRTPWSLTEGHTAHLGSAKE